ncbi:MAG: hypothetical protein LBT10_05485 [Methanobrevibacter sp.]|jgi:hypothetical protein|nr:hypothetical protein [Methanobrevibacter sp.]
MLDKNQSLNIKFGSQAYKVCDNDFNVEVRKGRLVLKEGMGIRTILRFLEYFEEDVEFIINNEKDNCRNYNS